MSLAKRIFGNKESETPGESEDEDDEAENKLGDAVQVVFDEETNPQYDMTHETQFAFPETTTITHIKESGEIRVSIETPTTNMEFEVRVDGYTALFGEVDAEYICVSGYALNVYYPRPDSEDYFVRRLYFYEDEGGIGGEQHRENSSAPHNPVWERSKHLGGTVSTDKTEAHMRVYDWREQMLTHDKPTPKSGEVVIRYKDSPNSGGNRERQNIVVLVDDIKTPVTCPTDVEYIGFDVETGTLQLYCRQNPSDWLVASIPLKESVDASEIEWEQREEYIRASKISTLIWVRNPVDTWSVDNRF